MGLRFGIFALACAVLSPVVAKADDFSMTGQGFAISFTVPDSPMPDAFQSGVGFVINNVTVDVNGTKSLTDVGFGNPVFPDLFIGTGPDLSKAQEIDAGNPSWGFFTGALLYSGTEDAPTFLPGTYAITNIEGASTGGTPAETFSLSVTPSAVSTPVGSSVAPEPSSFLLLGTGLLGAVGVARRRWAL